MFWTISKLFWGLFQPFNWLIAANLIGLWLLFRHQTGAAIIAFLFTPVFLLTLMMTPLAERMISPLEQRFAVPASLPDDLGGIIVLGGAMNTFEVDGPVQPLTDAVDRVIAGWVLQAERKDVPLILTGASASLFYSGRSEAARFGELTETLFPQRPEIIIDELSQNTCQHPDKLKTLVPGWEDKSFALVTSAYHIPRAVGCFRKQGWNVVAVPTDILADPRASFGRPQQIQWRFLIFQRAVREWIGLTVYRVLGRTDALLPSP